MFVLGLIVRGHATVLVNDTWQDGTRTDPASPVYSENGTDTDADEDLESAWFNTGGTLTPSPGHLIGTMPANGTSSASWTTYFTPEAAPVTLATAGDALQVTWIFTPTNVGGLANQNFRLAVVDSPSVARRTTDGSPSDGTYAGYGMFMNMATMLGGTTPFQLMERSAPGTSSALLSSSSSWTGLANGAVNGHAGYASGTQYTFVMTLTRNASSGLDITVTMTGGSLNNTGSASVSFTDNTPNSFIYDTFALRPSSANDSAAQFNTTLFKVEAVTANTPPSISADRRTKRFLWDKTPRSTFLPPARHP